MLKVLIYATDTHHGNISHLKTKIGAEILPILLPWTMDFYPKSYSVKEYLKNSHTHQEDLVLVCDAYDVLCLNFCSLSSLETKIISCFDINKVTFNAETNCFPDGGLAQFYPRAPGKWKYLNGGIYVGKAKNILIMLEEVMPRIIGSDEQLEFSKLFLDGNLINLDYKCEVFQTLYAGRVGGDIDFSDFIVDGKLVYNKYFNTLPLLFHGNGKVNMSNLIQYC